MWVVIFFWQWTEIYVVKYLTTVSTSNDPCADFEMKTLPTTYNKTVYSFYIYQCIFASNVVVDATEILSREEWTTY